MRTNVKVEDVHRQTYSRTRIGDIDYTSYVTLNRGARQQEIDLVVAVPCDIVSKRCLRKKKLDETSGQRPLRHYSPQTRKRTKRPRNLELAETSAEVPRRNMGERIRAKKKTQREELQTHRIVSNTQLPSDKSVDTQPSHRDSAVCHVHPH
jgi:hypothetical protein